MVHIDESAFIQEATSDGKKGIPFAIETVSEPQKETADKIDFPSVDISVQDGIQASPGDFDLDDATESYRFAPTYYPKRFTQSTDNEISRTPRQCGGEDVYIKNIKNTDFHVNGIVLAENIRLLRHILRHEGPVDLITPMAEDGGIEAVIKSGEIGEITGWDSLEEQWQFKYTIDLVSTGADENANDGSNQIVSKVTEDGLL